MKSKFLKSITTLTVVFMSSMIIGGHAIAEVDKSQPIHILSHWKNTGGSHGVGKAIVSYLEEQGWTNINNGKGYLSLGGCANAINQRTKTSGPVFWLQGNPVLGQPADHPCYVDEVNADEFVVPFFGWTDFICRRSDLDLPPINEATGTIRVAVDLPEFFGEVEEEILRAMAPNANVVLMHYAGSTGALKAVQAKEVHYTWSTLFEERSEGRVECDYNTSTKSFRGTTALREAFPNLDVKEGRWLSYKGANWAWWNATNASGELKAAFAKDWADAYYEHEQTMNIVKSRGYVPPDRSKDLTDEEMKNMVGEKWTGRFDGYEN